MRKSEKFLRSSTSNLFDLLDGPKRVKRLIHKIIKKEKGLYGVDFSALTIYRRLKKIRIKSRGVFEA